MNKLTSSIAVAVIGVASLIAWVTFSGIGSVSYSAAGVQVSVPSAGGDGYLPISTTTGQYKTISSTSSPQFWVNSNRTDTYTADGGILRPWKTLTSAASAITALGVTSAQINIAPGTYTEQSLTLPNIPLVIHGNGASIIMLSGASLGAGTLTIPSDLSWYDATIFGNVTLTSTSLTNPHSFQNSFIAGNLWFGGNATFNNGAIVDQRIDTFPFLSQNASSTFTAGAGSLVNAQASNIQVAVNAQGILNINNVNVQTSTSTRYAIVASTTGSVLRVSGASIQNGLTGGGISCSNGATSANPNQITAVQLTLAAGSTGAIDCGSATTFIGTYTAFTTAGVRLIASGTDKLYPNMEGINVDNRIGIASTTPGVPLAVTGAGVFTDWVTAPQFNATSTVTASLFNLLTVATTFTLAGQTGCATFSAGVLSGTGSACGSSSGLTSYDAWTHPSAGQSATTSLMKFSNSGTTTFSGGLEANGIGAPWFSATNTSATSTFQGGINTASLRLTPTTNKVLYTGNDGLVVGAASSSLSLPNTALQNSTISGVALGSSLAALTAGNTSLTFSGSYDGSAARTVTLTSRTINGVTFDGTANITITAASSTLLSDTNIFSTAGTTTFSNGVSVGNLAQTGTATSTLNRGITLASGCFAVQNSCLSLSTLPGTITLTTQVTGDLPFANLAQVAAGSVLGNPTGSTADAQSVATSTLFGNGGTPGFVLMWDGTKTVWIATSTCVAITGSSALCDGDDATGGGGGSSSDPFTHPALGQSATTSLLILNGNASTTALSVFNKAFFGAAATTTVNSIGQIDFPSTNQQSTSTFMTWGGRSLLSASSSDTGSAGANLFFGLDSGSNITSGFQNTGFGYQALKNAKTTSHNTAFGYSALASTVDGIDNVAVGPAVLFSNTGGSDNTGVGAGSVLAFNTTGANNTALGYATLNSNTTGISNTAVGQSALVFNDTGDYNTGIGYNALWSNTSGRYNTALGMQAGYSITTGSDNILIGHTENTGGNAITTGGGNIGLGYNVVFPSSNSRSMLNIGNFIFAKLPATTTATTLPSSFNGAVGIATTSPFFALTVASSAAPQFALADASLTSNAWTMRSISNSLYISTSSPTTFATSTVPAIWIDPNGLVTFGRNSSTTLATFQNIVIATSTPFQAPLASTSLQIVGQDGTPARMSIDTFSSLNNFGSQIQFRRARGIGSSPLAVAADDTLFSLAANGWGTTGFNATSIGSLNFMAADVFTDTYKPTYATIYTSNGSTQTEKVRITSSGKTGFGTTTPWGLLSIASSTPDGITPLVAVGPQAGPYFLINNGGKTGVGTTTPWGMLSIASSSPDYLTPLFAIATSTQNGSNLVSVFATSTTLSSNVVTMAAAFANNVWDSGVRVVIGEFQKYQGLLLDQLNINGRINTGEWFLAECSGAGGIAATISANTTNFCGGWGFHIDTAGQASGTVSPASAFVLHIPVANANGGAGVFYNAVTVNWMKAATSTPVMEFSVCGADAQTCTGSSSFGSVSTSSVFMGFANITPGGNAYETAPTAGCYVTASSTQPNFRAVCSTSAAAMTIFDTGFSSTTPTFLKFRIEMDNAKAKFYVQTPTTTMKMLTAMSGANYPGTTALTPQIVISRTTSGVITSVSISSIRLWFRKTLWPN